MWPQTYTRSCYGNRETVTSLSNFWSCQVVVTRPSSKVINKQISFILFILHLTETLVPLLDTLVLLFDRDTHSLYLTETLVPLYDRDTGTFLRMRHLHRDTRPFIWQTGWQRAKFAVWRGNKYYFALQTELWAYIIYIVPMVAGWGANIKHKDSTRHVVQNSNINYIWAGTCVSWSCYV